MQCTVRPAVHADAAAIASVQVSTWNSTYTGIVPDAFLAAFTIDSQIPGWQAHLAAPDALIFVAESQGSVVGFATGGPLREPWKTYDAELYTIYLLPSWQRRGIGRDLLRTLAAALLARRFTSLLVWALEQNPFVAFYRHFGAVPELRRSIEIGGAQLPDLALGWPDLPALLHRLQPPPPAETAEPPVAVC